MKFLTQSERAMARIVPSKAWSNAIAGPRLEMARDMVGDALNIDGVPLSYYVLQRLEGDRRQATATRATHKRGRLRREAAHVSREARRAKRRDFYALYLGAVAAQREIARVFLRRRGMTWRDVEKELHTRGWSWRQLYLLAQAEGIAAA